MVLVAIGAMILGITAGVLGSVAVLQSRSLVGDALAHAALPGVAVAFIITGARDPSTLLAGAIIAGLIASFAILAIERSGRLRTDTAIGVVLAGGFSAGIVLLTWIAGSGRGQQAGLEAYLFGQAAGIVSADVVTSLVLMVASIAVLVLLYRPLKAVIFDRAFSAATGVRVRAVEAASIVLLVTAVVIGLRMVGAILMVVMLIAPGVTARHLTDRMAVMLVLAGAIGGAMAVAGALLSSAIGVPTGPVIALVGTAGATAVILGAPGRGVIWHAARRRRARGRHRATEILLALDALGGGTTPVTPAGIAMQTARGHGWVRRGLGDLTRGGLAGAHGDGMVLTASGRAAARDATDDRAAWAAWLEHGWQIALPDAREPDPTDVRGSIGEEATARLLTLAGQRGADAALR